MLNELLGILVHVLAEVSDLICAGHVSLFIRTPVYQFEQCLFPVLAIDAGVVGLDEGLVTNPVPYRVVEYGYLLVDLGLVLVVHFSVVRQFLGHAPDELLLVLGDDDELVSGVLAQFLGQGELVDVLVLAQFVDHDGELLLLVPVILADELQLDFQLRNLLQVLALLLDAQLRLDEVPGIALLEQLVQLLAPALQDEQVVIHAGHHLVVGTLPDQPVGGQSQALHLLLDGPAVQLAVGQLFLQVGDLLGLG